MELNLSKEIDGHIINPELTRGMLLEAHFREIKHKDKHYFYHYFTLYPHEEFSVTLNIKIDLNKEFDIIKDIDVLDEAFCQPFTPFYTFGDNQKTETNKKIIQVYNEKMDMLCNRGIFIKSDKCLKDLLKK